MLGEPRAVRPRRAHDLRVVLLPLPQLRRIRTPIDLALVFVGFLPDRSASRPQLFEYDGAAGSACSVLCGRRRRCQGGFGAWPSDGAADDDRAERHGPGLAQAPSAGLGAAARGRLVRVRAVHARRRRDGGRRDQGLGQDPMVKTAEDGSGTCTQRSLAWTSENIKQIGRGRRAVEHEQVRCEHLGAQVRLAAGQAPSLDGLPVRSRSSTWFLKRAERY